MIELGFYSVLSALGALCVSGCTILFSPDSGSTCSSLSFDGGDWVQIAADPILGAESFSAAAWYRPDALGGADQHVISHVDVDALKGFSLEVYQDGTPGFFVFTPGGLCGAQSDAAVAPEEWVHLAGSFHSNTATLFINGEERASIPCAGNRNRLDRPLSIGKFLDRDEQFASGLIDSVRLAPTPMVEGFDLEDQPGCEVAGTVLYEFDEGSGQEVADACERGAPGYLGGASSDNPEEDPLWVAVCPPVAGP